MESVNSKKIICLFTIDLNLLDWSANNHVALSLNNAVYLWNAGNGAISQLLELENSDEYVSSVSWIKEGNILAVGNSIGCVQVLQSASAMQVVRFIHFNEMQ